MRDPNANLLDRLDPNLALRPGDFDAQAVLFTWCVRKSFFPTLWLGVSVALVGFGDLESVEQSLETFDNPAAMASAVLSPLGVLVAAVAIRVVNNWVALGAAYPLTSGASREQYRESNRVTRWFHFWRDRLYRARAYRSLRLTWRVRKVAYERLDVSARVFRTCEFVLSWANVVLLITMFVVLGFVGAEAGN